MRIVFTLLVLLFSSVPTIVLGDTFGSGANTFDIAFVNIGNPGNSADTTGDPNPAGSVPYTFRMGQFEISEQMIDKANALGGLGILRFDIVGPNQPIIQVAWNQAARFVNWLNTSTGSPPAYKFAVQPGQAGYDAYADIQLWTASDTGYNPSNLYRNALARYFLPSADEWYKAAYYDPAGKVYYDYPTGSNNVPMSVANGTAAGTAVFDFASGPADVTLAGGLSPYGTMGQGGNVYEWEETDYDRVNDLPSSAREVRGGNWVYGSGELQSSVRMSMPPTYSSNFTGFRVASLTTPEPSTILLAVTACIAVPTRRRKSVPHSRV
jgi:formylglycine-generating enzyme required for sulfatase activity